jgi:hypothetical protein
MNQAQMKTSYRLSPICFKTNPVELNMASMFYFHAFFATESCDKHFYSHIESKNITFCTNFNILPPNLARVSKPSLFVAKQTNPENLDILEVSNCGEASSEELSSP